ncbi:hypothetical protein VP01_1065g1 [Puccinia sorghi]|uniref:Cytoplasmic tRNA 2-thiolation protein 2 n=1 Tax=Puccinia sorghi TaxID=27349 RepID=A0A0L6VTR1_9BASI|nr:hypothetical protein VP01_1065g1 [Puccinia sorghi]
MNHFSCCCKCHSPNILPSTIRNTAWCRDCFLDNINNRFFQGLKIAREHCRPPPRAKHHETHISISEPSSLVIHCKHDLSSWQMMRHYLQTNQHRSTPKWKNPIDFSAIQVVSVDIGSAASLLSCSSQAELKTDEDLKSMVERFGFSFESLKLHDLFHQPASLPQHSSARCSTFVDISDPSRVQSFLPHEYTAHIDTPFSPCGNTDLPIKTMDLTDPETAIPTETLMDPLANTLRPLTQTSRRSLVDSLINKRLLDFCHHTPRNKVLIKTTTSTHMAIDTLLGVALGNGWSLDQQIGPSSYVDDILICRPLAQIVDAELAQYSQLLDPDHTHPLTHPSAAKKPDMSALITDFVVKLEENYPMTSAVINQTVNKIGKNKGATAAASSASVSNWSHASTGDLDTCAICQLSVYFLDLHREDIVQLASDPKAQEWKRSITLRSHEAGLDDGAGGQATAAADGAATGKGEDLVLLRDQVCYGCLVTFSDHQYIHHSSDRPVHNWVQLPNFFLPPSSAPPAAPAAGDDAPPPTREIPSSIAPQLQAVLDQFLIPEPALLSN